MQIREAYSYRADSAVPTFPDDHPIIIFDGHCALCSGWARFVIRHDPDKHFRLLAAQTPLGRALYVHYGLDPLDYETNILLVDGCSFLKSEGSIRMAEKLGWPWSLAAALRVLPLAARDWLYERLARNRMRIFGRLETCYRPSVGDQERFIG
jgi:predicted DCC family thiol-disulfide oxidoreductase YuxK